MFLRLINYLVDVPSDEGGGFVAGDDVVDDELVLVLEPVDPLDEEVEAGLDGHTLIHRFLFNP